MKKEGQCSKLINFLLNVANSDFNFTIDCQMKHHSYNYVANYLKLVSIVILYHFFVEIITLIRTKIICIINPTWAGGGASRPAA